MHLKDLNRFSGLSENEYTINQEYIRPTVADGIEDWDPQRVDQHIYVHDKLVSLIEDRAWVDKPFYMLKRQVFMNMELTPYTRRLLTPQTTFLVVGLNIDITNRLVKTQDKIYQLQHELFLIPLSKGRRSTKENYFDRGLNDIALKHFSRYLGKTFPHQHHHAILDLKED